MHDADDPRDAAADAAREAAEQLEDAARTLASTPAALASSIASVRTVAPEDVPALRALAHRLGERYGLDVILEERTSLTVRFSR